ncbi:MAG: MFS transporter [Dehalococcoidales bacterium]
MWLPQWLRQLHYAWIVLAAVMVVSMVTAGVRISFGVLIDPLVEGYGWSRGDVSLAYTLQFLVGIPAVLVIGRLAERISPRRLVLAGGVIFTAGLLLIGTISQLWQFQLYFGVLVGGLGAAPFTVLLPVLLSRWFARRLGLAMGFMWVSLSIGPAILSPLIRGSIEAAGWSQTFSTLGLAGGAVLLAAAFFLSDRPEDKRLAPYGASPDKHAAADHTPPPAGSATPLAGFDLRQVLRTRSFRALVGVHALGCIGHSVLLAHMVSMATFSGIASVTAAGVLSMVVATSVISRFGMSLVAERKGARFTLAIAVLLQTVPTLLLLVTTELWSFYSFAFVFGLGYGGEMVGFPIFNRQYYGAGAPLNTIYSYQLAGAMLGMAVGGWLGGALFDWTGVYTWSLVSAAAAGFFGVAIALALPRRRTAGRLAGAQP